MGPSRPRFFCLFLAILPQSLSFSSPDAAAPQVAQTAIPLTSDTFVNILI